MDNEQCRMKIIYNSLSVFHNNFIHLHDIISTRNQHRHDNRRTTTGDN